MKGLDGKVALITGAGSEVGRAIALALAARGVRIIATGPHERALGETVGEIAYGGGKARHVVADVTISAELAAAAKRAFEVFGGLDFLVINAETAAEALRVFESCAERDVSRLIATVSSVGQAGIADLVQKAVHELSGKATCNAIVWRGDGDLKTEDVGRLAVVLCSADGEGTSGQTTVV